MKSFTVVSSSKKQQENTPLWRFSEAGSGDNVRENEQNRDEMLLPKYTLK